VEQLERLSDSELLGLSKTPATAHAFGTFYARHDKAVFAYLWRRTGDSEAALELTAEVFAAAILGARRFDPDRGPARAWLFGIANKKLAASRRRHALEHAARRRIGMPRLEFTDEMLDRVEEMADASRTTYLQDLDRLNPDERAAVEARVIDERDYADIAAGANASEAAIRQRVSRGLARLGELGRGRQ
jgi:RNA polymerase sigma factor (sigma-70 family)